MRDDWWFLYDDGDPEDEDNDDYWNPDDGITLNHTLNLLNLPDRTLELWGQQDEFRKRLPLLMVAARELIHLLLTLGADPHQVLKADPRLMSLLEFFIQWRIELSGAQSPQESHPLEFEITTGRLQNDMRLLKFMVERLKKSADMVLLEAQAGRIRLAAGGYGLSLPATITRGGRFVVDPRFVLTLLDHLKENEVIRCHTGPEGVAINNWWMIYSE